MLSVVLTLAVALLLGYRYGARLGGWLATFVLLILMWLTATAAPRRGTPGG